ncbi:putative coproporphyrinogen oxidase [Helianthus annuus]|nr:putative coproporphyrinogen oxidase [Helianthus annuus]
MVVRSLRRMFGRGRVGGGGISRILQDGAIWEKAGLNVSVVYAGADLYGAGRGPRTPMFF